MLLLAFASALALAPSPTSSPGAPPSEPAAVGKEPTVPLGDALTVRAGATCLDHARLVEQIRTWFDHERIDERLVIEVVGDAVDPRKLAFTIRRGEQVISVRRFEPAPDRCADLHAVVGLAIALAIDATLLESVAGDPTRPPRPPDPPPRDDEVPEPTKPKPVPPKPKPRAWRLWLEIAGHLSLGAPPDVGGGGRLGLRASWRRILDLGLGATAGSSGRTPIGEGRALLSVVAGRFDLCAGPPWARVRPRGCVGFLYGAAFAAGQGFDHDQTTRVSWVSIPVGVDLEVQLSRRVNFLVGIEGLPAVVRPTFQADSATGERDEIRFAPFGANVEAGLSVLLW